MAKRVSGEERTLQLQDCEAIRRTSSLAWDALIQAGSSTTYRGHYCAKALDEPTQLRVRPSSPTRRHRPHPLEGIVVNTHYRLPGYFIAQPSGKSTGMCSWRPPRGRLVTNTEKLKSAFDDPVLVQAALAWMNLAPQADCRAVEGLLETVCAKHPRSAPGDGPERGYLHEALSELLKPNCIPGMSEWLRTARKEEVCAVERLARTLFSGPVGRTPHQRPAQQGHRHWRSRDFVIHPDWVTQPWHQPCQRNAT